MQTKLVVVKFGGSSLAEAGQFKKVAEIIQAVHPDAMSFRQPPVKDIRRMRR